MAFAPLPPTTATPAVELLMDVAEASEEISSRLTVRAFAAIADPEKGPALREHGSSCLDLSQSPESH